MRVKCPVCGMEQDYDPADPVCIYCKNPLPPPQQVTPSPQQQPSTPAASSQPTPAAKFVVYALAKDGSKSVVTRIAEGGPEVVLGRNDLQKFAWRDPDTISRIHVKFKVIGGKVYVRDDGSTNGTYIDGADIRGKGDVEVPLGKEIVLVNPASPVVKLLVEPESGP